MYNVSSRSMVSNFVKLHHENRDCGYNDLEKGTWSLKHADIYILFLHIFVCCYCFCYSNFWQSFSLFTLDFIKMSLVKLWWPPLFTAWDLLLGAISGYLGGSFWGSFFYFSDSCSIFSQKVLCKCFLHYFDIHCTKKIQSMLPSPWGILRYF